MSAPLTPAPLTLTSTSPLPGSGSGCSWTLSVSSAMVAARMAREYGASADGTPSRGLPAHGHLAEGVRAPRRPGRDRRARLGADARPGRAQADRVRLRARAAPGVPRRV